MRSIHMKEKVYILRIIWGSAITTQLRDKTGGQIDDFDWLGDITSWQINDFGRLDADWKIIWHMP